ncbi:MAG: Fur family transcriptional regulator [Chloroflexota bacterium]
MSCEQFFITKLKERGFRLTPQREAILFTMHDIDRFATAETILQKVRVRDAAADRSTVYRTLDLLHEFQLVDVMEDSDGQRRFKLEGASDPHFHISCTRCGAVEGVPVEMMQSLRQTLGAQFDFHLEEEKVHLPGLCSRCKDQFDG